MTRNISLKELWIELLHDPDLRRLGSYKVVADPEQTILPIDINFEGKDVHFGDGDFTDGFLALCDTEADVVSFDSSKFLDLYLDNLKAERVSFADAEASRLYFDHAEIVECRFDDFVAPEVYFDDASIKHIEGDRLDTGILFVECLQSAGFKPNDMAKNAHRVIDTGVQASGTKQPEVSVVRELLQSEFQQLLAEDPDLRRLGPYKVVPESEDEIILDIDVECAEGAVNFGQGDFTGWNVQMTETKAELIDFADATFDAIDFADAEIGNCFLAGSEVQELHFGKAKIGNVFGEQCRVGAISFDEMECQQFNTNQMQTSQLRLGEARVRELYLSDGVGIEEMYFDRSQLDLLNLHEGSVNKVFFGESIVGRALINKAHITELNIEGLKADKLYIGNDGRNEIGRLKFEQIEGIGTINIDRAFQDASRRILGDVEGLASKYTPPELREHEDIRHEGEKFF